MTNWSVRYSYQKRDLQLMIKHKYRDLSFGQYIAAIHTPSARSPLSPPQQQRTRTALPPCQIRISERIISTTRLIICPRYSHQLLVVLRELLRDSTAKKLITSLSFCCLLRVKIGGIGLGFIFTFSSQGSRGTTSAEPKRVESACVY